MILNSFSLELPSGCMANPWVLSIGSHGYRVCQIHECTATLLHLWLCTWWQTYNCIHCLHMLHCQLLCLCNPLTCFHHLQRL
jgi:hypothetical protein